MQRPSGPVVEPEVGCMGEVRDRDSSAHLPPSLGRSRVLNRPEGSILISPA